MSAEPQERQSIPLAESEPTTGSGPAPVWLVVLFGLLVYWGQMYLDRYGGGFHPQVYDPYTSLKVVQDLQPKSEGDELFTRGSLVFKMNCEVCHQTHGRGDASRGFPPLAESDWVLASGPNRIIRVVLNGFTGPVTVKGQEFNNTMPPFRDVLTDDADIAAVLTFVRGNKEWGNNASPLKPEQVKAIREATKSRDTSWTAPELQKVPEVD